VIKDFIPQTGGNRRGIEIRLVDRSFPPKLNAFRPFAGRLSTFRANNMTAQTLLTRVIAFAGCMVTAAFPHSHAQEKNPNNAAATPPSPHYTVKLDTITSGFDGKTCWVAPRAGIVPGAGVDSGPAVVFTMQKLWLKGSDVFFAINEVRSDDLGKTWSPPKEHADSLGRRTEPNGVEIVVGDFVPKWHAKTGKLLGTGPTVRYQKNKTGAEVKINQNDAPSFPAYSTYDPQTRTWTPWEMVAMPKDPKFFYATVGASQRVDLPNGDILIPFHFKTQGQSPYHTAVMRCSFDGKKLTYIEHGDELSRPEEPGVEYKQPAGRQTGVFEPSLTFFQGRYYLAMRNDRAAYVATSDDGLHFGPVRRWRFDDGSDLGCRNTQQHWVNHSDRLLLTYTRVGANNDHVFRNRAPIFLAEVDPAQLQVIRSTERIIIPERGAGLGNAFGVTEVSANETWVTTSEWMQGPKGILMPGNQYGSDNSVYTARILWKTPNKTWDAR